MQISLKLKLDDKGDRLVFELEDVVAPEKISIRKFPIEGMKEPLELVLDQNGYLVQISLPGLARMLKAIGGGK